MAMNTLHLIVLIINTVVEIKLGIIFIVTGVYS